MKAKRVEYDLLAESYDQRFTSTRPSEIPTALIQQTQLAHASRLLEVGCGTGRWLGALKSISPSVAGLDLSQGMLRQAQMRDPGLNLVQGDAGCLPFQREAFDFVFCVHAIHHFSEGRNFIHEAYRVLQPGGCLAILGSDPHGRQERWYGYRYFEGTYETDLARFPGTRRINAWMASAGFERIARQSVERIEECKIGLEVLDDPYLQKQACSQLALLSDEAYRKGLRRIERHIRQAEAGGLQLEFRTEIEICMWVGYKGEQTQCE